MKNHVTEQFSDYVMNRLDRIEKAEVDSHLEECASCREEFDGLLRLWAKLGTIPEEQPGEALRVRFHAMLEAYEEGAKRSKASSARFLAPLNNFLGHIWPKEPALQFGLGFMLLVAGFIGGIKVGTPSDEQMEISHLRSEIQTMGHLLTISLLSQQSASERLRGVSWTTQIDHPDPQVVGALVKALRYDQNVNVRLAAVDALGKFLGDPNVRTEVIDALPTQNSPLVQIALVDLMVQEHVKQSEEVLKKMAADPKVNKSVKERIEQGMKELSL